MQTISGPQGPRVVLDGRPVLLLCSDNYLGLADHARVREAAADAALRWGVGAGSLRMTVHRRLERALAGFHGTEAALLAGAGEAIRALAGPGDLVLADALNAPALADGCRLSGAEVVEYAHADPDHLAWGLRQQDGRQALIVTEGVFAADGDVAPLEDVVGLAHRHGARVLVDESHAVGALGPGGRGAAAEAGLAQEVDVITGSLGTALGAHGTYVACAAGLADRIERSSAPAPPVAAGALAALELLAEEPGRVDRLAALSRDLHDGLVREGFEVAGCSTHIVPLIVGDEDDAARMSAAALDQGVFVPAGTDRLRLTVMASHTRSELREAARVLGRAALLVGLRPGTMVPVAEAQQSGVVVPLVPRAA